MEHHRRADLRSVIRLLTADGGLRAFGANRPLQRSSRVPGAAQREAMRCRPGTFTTLRVWKGPGSAVQHCVPHRIRDTPLNAENHAPPPAPTRIDTPAPAHTLNIVPR